MKTPAFIFAGILAVASLASAIPNPAAEFCVKCGYRYEIRTDPQGGQYGVCVFPDGSECDEWAYYRKCNAPQNCEGDCNCPWPCPKRIIYVDDDANGLNDGSSWVNAYKYLQDALVDANSSARPVEIRVAQGIYKPDQGVGITPGDREATFQLINGVTLKGGYAGFGQPDPNARDIVKYETVLIGDLNGDDADVSNPYDLLNESTRAENSFHVVSAMRRIDETAVLDGFVITGGNANGEYWGKYYPVYQCLGGGMYIFEYSSPLVRHCTFRDNSASHWGGGMNGSGTITDCKFIGNAAEYSGGFDGSWFGTSTLTNCEFIGNAAEYGGGMGGEGTLTDCKFIGNLAGIWGGGVSGGATLTNCTFIANSAGIAAGALCGCGTLINCVFSGNTTGQRGGAMYSYCYPCEEKVINCTFTGNSAGEYGGALFLGDESDRQLLNCIIWGNSASEGAQIAVDANYASGLSISYCNIQGGKAEIYGCEPIVKWGEGNTDDDPCFADVNNGDYHLRSQAGRWDPNSQGWVKDEVTSPCVDSGDPSSPIGLETFPNGGIINMGAYGGTAEASKSHFGKPPCEIIVAGDINGDCKVNLWDLAIMTSHWLEEH